MGYDTIDVQRYISSKKAVAQYLLENGADPRIEDSRGRTHLVHAD